MKQRGSRAASKKSGAQARVTQPTLSAEQIWAELMAGNKRFVAGKPKARGLVRLRKGLANSQKPLVVVLSCSDSRVASEIIFDQNLGDLFVVRTAGNIAGPIGLGSLEFAAQQLGAKMLVVLGHSKCGAVTAACSSEKMPTPCLQAIVDKIIPAVLRVPKTDDRDAFIEAAIQENVHQSTRDILRNSEVLRRLLKEGKLAVIEAEYHLDSGEIVRLGATKA